MFLFQACAHGELGRIHGYTGLGPRRRVSQQSRRDQGRLGSLEGGDAVRGPQLLFYEFGIATRDHTAMERDESGSDMREKPMIKIDHPEEALQMSLGCRLRELGNRLDSALQRAYAFGADRVAQKIEGRHAQEALVLVDKQPVVTKKGKDGSQMF